ncbi:MAG: hypothetical protein CVV42_16595 [Candidatus Riflebacteria bacterium HGW-Riflebacteria-2]|jgi:hypothetical protein|nr:MAG: hypothetical protein CVV42_16595 [Candidatus Riflebacteria bacterium HGW-Riflebacteria-2]
MKSNLRRLTYTAVLVAACLLNTLELFAARPSGSEVARKISSTVVFRLAGKLQMLSTEQMAEILDRRKGVQIIDGRILKRLMEWDTKSESDELYDDIMRMESGNYPSHCYCIFNKDMENLDNEFFLMDTRHGHLSGLTGNSFSDVGPRSLFKELCTLTGNDEFYEKYASEFIEETETQKKQKATSARNSPFMEMLAKYGLWLLLLNFLDFIFFDLSYMKNEKWPVKLYGLGMQLVCTVVFLSIVTIHYTNTPIPGMRSFSHLASGFYPSEVHVLSDVILITSFSWWFISIAAIYLAPRYKCSPAIPMLYVVFMPMALAMSESPFGGSQIFAFPLCGMILLTINYIYIQKKYKS